MEELAASGKWFEASLAGFPSSMMDKAVMGMAVANGLRWDGYCSRAMSATHGLMWRMSRVPGNTPAPFGNEFGIYGVSLLKD